jgi:hypothetical protein
MGTSPGRHDDVGVSYQHGVGGITQLFGSREKNDLSLFFFSALSRWLCIESFVGAAPI